MQILLNSAIELLFKREIWSIPVYSSTFQAMHNSIPEDCIEIYGKAFFIRR